MMKAAIRRMEKRGIDACLRTKPTRRLLNGVYNLLSNKGKSEFYWLCAKRFRQGQSPDLHFDWKVRFANTQIKLPVAGETLWLDWDLAVSFLGHDTEVKETYDFLLNSSYRPRVFFDVGTNYGLDSLYFLANGVKTLSFEPNPSCYPYFRRAAKLNNLPLDIQEFAVGEADGEVSLTFPERETWWGSIDAHTIEEFKKNNTKLVTIPVKIIKLDDFVKTSACTPDLIKIDTEGNELKVFMGASRVLNEARPLVIFECNTETGRDELFSFLAPLGYLIFSLPFVDPGKSIAFTAENFRKDSGTNFLAIPKEKHLPVTAPAGTPPLH